MIHGLQCTSVYFDLLLIAYMYTRLLHVFYSTFTHVLFDFYTCLFSIHVNMKNMQEAKIKRLVQLHSLFI